MDINEIVAPRRRPLSHLSLNEPIESFFDRERNRPAPFGGQRDPAFQAALAEYHEGLTPADCDFYHTIETPDGAVHPGAWDLRGHEAAYLGNVSLNGASVLEFGPASGWLSAHIARSARLTVLDLPFGGSPDMIPFPGMDMVEARRSATQSFARLRNSWWYTRQQFGFDAEAIYADIYHLPSDLRRTQISVFGAILLHLCSPFQALAQAAALTDDAIVVTDVLADGVPVNRRGAVERAVSGVLFSPSPYPVGLTHWWGLSPAHVEQMLHRLGFGDVVVNTHSPARMSPAPTMFTVVGRRPRTSIAMPPVPEAKRAEPSPAPTPAPSSGVPVPPAALRMLVAGTEDARIFLELGRLGFEALTASLRKNGIDPASVGRVLDFGCGCGRVTRYWAPLRTVSVEGTDLSANAIAWDQANLTFGSFGTNGLEPALSFEDGRFGLIYALSVFTHLPTDMQVGWLQELLRITAIGGYVYVTTHGVRYLNLLSPTELKAFKAGKVVVTGDEAPGMNHCAAFHPVSWFEKQAGLLGFEIVEHLPCGAKGNPEQDSWLLRRKA